MISKVSIITVCFNSEGWIKDSIKSVLLQTYDNIDYYIIDGRSEDRTLDVIFKTLSSLNVQKDINYQLDKEISRDCKSHKFGSLHGKNIYIISQNDNGVYDAMNKGIDFVSEGFVGILNSDDIYASDKIISNIVSEFERSNCDAVYGNLSFFRQNISNVIRYWKASAYQQGSFKLGWHPPHPTFFVKKEMYKKYGKFDCDLHLAADFDLMLRFIEINKISVSFLNQNLVYMRYGGQSTKSIRNILIGQRDIWRSFKKNNVKISFFYYYKRLMPKLMQLIKG